MPLTLGSADLLDAFGVPLRFLAIALVPALCWAIAMRWRFWRDRRMGRRFSLYDADAMSR